MNLFNCVVTFIQCRKTGNQIVRSRYACSIQIVSHSKCISKICHPFWHFGKPGRPVIEIKSFELNRKVNPHFFFCSSTHFNVNGNVVMDLHFLHHEQPTNVLKCFLECLLQRLLPLLFFCLLTFFLFLSLWLSHSLKRDTFITIIIHNNFNLNFCSRRHFFQCTKTVHDTVPFCRYCFYQFSTLALIHLYSAISWLSS